jgi:hypothetical protein
MKEEYFLTLAALSSAGLRYSGPRLRLDRLSALGNRPYMDCMNCSRVNSAWARMDLIAGSAGLRPAAQSLRATGRF